MLKLTEVGEGQKITLRVSNESNSMRLNAVIIRHVKDIYTIIDIVDWEGSKLVFDNVRVDVEYVEGNGVPTIWNNVKIANYNDDHVLQVISPGSKSNRRNAFRVSVAKAGRIYTDKQTLMTTIKDVSLSGFSVVDKKDELILEKNDAVRISFEDLGYKFELSGRLNRIEKREKMIIYGFKINSLSKDLPEYIMNKQKYNRSKK